MEIAEMILIEKGFVVDKAWNGAEAVSKVQSDAGFEYNVILMDIQMPVMDGYEAARQIRAMKDSMRAKIAIVAMTANAFEEDKTTALKAGMDGHIAKPIDIEKLIELLGGILKRENKAAG